MKNWKAWLALAMAVGLVYFMAFHWHRFLHDFWPLDGSAISPNLVASVVQYAVIVIAVALLYPPARRAIDRYIRGHVESIKAHVSAEHELVHKKLDHVIFHSKDIPPFDPKGTS